MTGPSGLLGTAQEEYDMKSKMSCFMILAMRRESFRLESKSETEKLESDE